MNEVRKCPKCLGEMESGYMYAGWVRGDIDLFSRARKTDAYRCRNCGYLELYVREDKHRP